MRALISRLAPKLWQVAALGFVAGVSLHAFAVMAVLDGGDDDAAELPLVAPTRIVPVSEAPVTPTPLLDRMDCEEMRGTDYRSPSERTWFLSNCVS